MVISFAHAQKYERVATRVVGMEFVFLPKVDMYEILYGSYSSAVVMVMNCKCMCMCMCMCMCDVCMFHCVTCTCMCVHI